MKKQVKTLYISDLSIQKAISKPIPKKIIDSFYDTPLTASQIADAVSFPKDKIYYHIKKLIAHDIIYIAETKEIKGIVQKKFLPTSEKIIFGDAPDKIKKDTGDDPKLEQIKIDSIEKQETIISAKTILKDIDSSDKIESGLKTEKQKTLNLSNVTDIPDPSNLLRAIYDRRKSRDRRSDYIRRSDFERRIKQFFDYTSPDRRTNNLRRKIEDRRFVENRRFENDRRLEGEGKIIKRSNQKINLQKSQPYISSPFLFNSLAHLQGMKKAITFVQSGNSVTYMQAQMGLDDFIIKEIQQYTLPLRIEDHLIQTFPELIRHVYYQTVDTSRSKDYYLAVSSSDYDYQMVYIDTENLDDNIETYISNNLQKSFSINKDRIIMDWEMNDTNEHNAVVCFSAKVDSIKSDYSALTSFGIQPRYNTSIPQILYNIYRYSHFGIGGGNALIIYIEKYRTNLILIQNARLVDSQSFTIGFDSFVNVITALFRDEDNQDTGVRMAAARFLKEYGVSYSKSDNSDHVITKSKIETASDLLGPMVESFRSEVLSSYTFFSGVRNKISGRGIVVDNVFMGGAGAQIKNMKETIHDLLNYPVHSLDDLYHGHTKKLTLPRQQKKLARNQKSLLKEQSKGTQELTKVKEKIDANEKELSIFNDLSKLESERDELILEKAHKLKDLEKAEQSLLLAKLKKTNLDDRFTTEKKRITKKLETISDKLDSAEKENLDRYKNADLIAQYVTNLSEHDNSRLIDNGQSVAEIKIIIRDLNHEKDETEADKISIESEIDMISSKIVQQEKAIELNLKEHVYTSSDLEQKRKQSDHFSSNPWRTPKTTIDLRDVLAKETSDLALRIKELDISLITKNANFEKYNDKRIELIRLLSPLNIELEESVNRYDEQDSRYLNTSHEHDKILTSLNILGSDYQKTSSIYLASLSDLDSSIEGLDQNAVVKSMDQAKINLVKLKKDQEGNRLHLNSIEKQFELEVAHTTAEQKNLNKKREMAENSFQSTHRKILSANSILEQNIKEIDDAKGQLSCLNFLGSALKTTHDLLPLSFTIDLIAVNNVDRSIETALATSQKAITWSLSQLESYRDKFVSQNSENLKMKKKRNRHEKIELMFAKNILEVIDILLYIPQDLDVLREKLRELKIIHDSKSNYVDSLNNNNVLTDDIQLNKSQLIKQKNVDDRLVKSNTKEIKQKRSQLKNEERILEENISSATRIRAELETIRESNAQNNDTHNEIIKSRISEIEKIKLAIEQLYLSKRTITELSSEKRLCATALVESVKAAEAQTKNISTLDENLGEASRLHAQKTDELNNKSKESEKHINQLFNEISIEENWVKLSKSRVKEIQNEKRVWKEETIILKDEDKTLSLQSTKMRRDTIAKKEFFQKEFSANIEKIEIEQSTVIHKANTERETIKQRLFVELGTLQKQEDGIQRQFKSEVEKLDAISSATQKIKDEIVKEKNRISSGLSTMMKESIKHQDSRDSLQSGIHKLQNKLKSISSKKDKLENQLSDRVLNTAERVSRLEERIIYKKTDDYLSFVIEGLGRVGSDTDQIATAEQIITESIETDTSEVSASKKSLKTFSQRAKENLLECLAAIKTINKELTPFKKQRDGLTRKIRLINKKIELLNRPVNRLEKKYKKMADEKQFEEKNFLLFQNTIEDELTQINQKRGEIEDSGSEEIKKIDTSLKDSISKIQSTIEDNSNRYNSLLHQADEDLSSILEKIGKRLEKIKIIISAGDKIQEENRAEISSIISRRKTTTQVIRNHKKRIKSRQQDIKKTSSQIKIEIERHSKYREKMLQQINRAEDVSLSLNTSKQDKMQQLSIVNSRLADFIDKTPNIDNDIGTLEIQIEELKNKNKSDTSKQSSSNNKFLIAETRSIDNIKSFDKKTADAESSISQLKIALSVKEDEQNSLINEIVKTENALTDLEIKYKQSNHEIHDTTQQIDSLTREEKKAKSFVQGSVLHFRKNEEVRDNIIPQLKDRIEASEGFIKEFISDQKSLKDSLKQLKMTQKTKSLALVSVEQEISVINKKINATEKSVQINKNEIETDFTNKKILIDRLHYDIMNLDDKRESISIQLATLSDQKLATEKAVNDFDKDFQDKKSTFEQLRVTLEKEKSELKNTLSVLSASVIDLKKRKEPLTRERNETNNIIENLKIDIDQISSEIKIAKMSHRDNEKNIKKADKIIASEKQKMRDEEEKIKQSIRDLESMLENASSYNKEQRKLLEKSIHKKIELEDALSDKKTKEQVLESKILNTEDLILDKKKLNKLKHEEKTLTKTINMAENKINHIQESYRSINEIILETERTYDHDSKPLATKISAAELAIIDINTAIREADKRLLKLNQQIRIAPAKVKKLRSLNQKYLKQRDQHQLRLKEATRALQLIKKKIEIMAKEKTDTDNNAIITKDIDYIANIGLLLNPKETLNLLPQQHKTDYSFYIPNRLLQVGTILFLFLSTVIGVYQTKALDLKENAIPDMIQKFSVASSEQKVYEDLLNDIGILDQLETKVVADETTSNNIISLLKYVSSAVPKEFKVTQIRVNEPKYFEEQINNLTEDSDYAYTSLSIYVGGFFKMNSSKSKKLLNGFQDQIEMSQHFKEIQINQQAGSNKSRTVYEINLLL